jgi:hypothetical protein
MPAACCGSAFAPSDLHENPPHRLGRGAKKMATTIPMLGLVAIDEPKVGLVDEGGSLKCLPWLLEGESLRRQPP